MRDRPLANLKKSAARSIRFAVNSPPLNFVPAWCYLSIGTNLLLLVFILNLGMRDRSTAIPASQALSETSASPAIAVSDQQTTTAEAVPETGLGARHQLTYEQWVSLLEQEATAVAENPPERLNVLMGDSISLWFPHDLLPAQQSWLNQGISGEVSAGLLKRLDLIAQTQPDTIFVMIGINDLIRDVSGDTILANQRLIIQTLKEMHPRANIVVQSILPHAAELITWEGKERLLEIPNRRIQALNTELEAIARDEDVLFLDLYPLFSDAEGNLRMELSTDGLHLNAEGYLVWSSALQLYSQLELEEP